MLWMRKIFPLFHKGLTARLQDIIVACDSVRRCTLPLQRHKSMTKKCKKTHNFFALKMQLFPTKGRQLNKDPPRQATRHVLKDSSLIYNTAVWPRLAWPSKLDNVAPLTDALKHLHLLNLIPFVFFTRCCRNNFRTPFKICSKFLLKYLG